MEPDQAQFYQSIYEHDTADVIIFYAYGENQESIEFQVQIDLFQDFSILKYRSLDLIIRCSFSL